MEITGYLFPPQAVAGFVQGRCRASSTEIYILATSDDSAVAIHVDPDGKLKDYQFKNSCFRVMCMNTLLDYSIFRYRPKKSRSFYFRYISQVEISNSRAVVREKAKTGRIAGRRPDGATPRRVVAFIMMTSAALHCRSLQSAFSCTHKAL